MSAAEEVHSDTDDDGYYGHSPSPAFSPSRPPGDDSSHIDTDSSADSFSANEHQDVDSDDEDSRHGKKRIPERVGNFRLLAKHKIDVAPYPRVAKWVSEKSGLKVVWADTPVRLITFLNSIELRASADRKREYRRISLPPSPQRLSPRYSTRVVSHTHSNISPSQLQNSE